MAIVLGVALVACREDEQGVLQPLAPLAGLRYVNLVPDTGAVDFRIVDIIGDAPSAGAAAFRTGGWPNGVSTNFMPPHFPVEAGTRRIRVFMTGTTPEIASQVVLDTPVTFVENVNYTFYLYGYRRAGRTPSISYLVSEDNVSAPAAGKIGFRVINFAPSLAGAVPPLADTTVRPDLFLRAPQAVPLAAALTGAANATAPAFAVPTSYVLTLDTGNYWAEMTATGSLTPIFIDSLYRGATATATVDVAAGTAQPGTVFTFLIVPRSTGGGPAGVTAKAATAPPLVDAVTRAVDVVTYQTGYRRTWVRRTVDSSGVQVSRPDTVISASAVNVPHGMAAGSFIAVYGANEPEYNGWQRVTATADTTTCIPVDSLVDLRRSCTTLNPATGAPSNVILNLTYRFRYRIVGAPATPATGTIMVMGPNTSLNHSIPAIRTMIDRKPQRVLP